jgi:hypothetical protein
MSSDDPRIPVELDSAMGRALADKTSPTPTEILDAAERLLDQVLRTECENRSSALDLLTVDALMTRALEIAARDPETLDSFARDAMHRIAAK